MIKTKKPSVAPASLAVQVLLPKTVHQRGWAKCVVGKHVEFDTAGLESYLFAASDPVIYDLLILAAAVEYADRKLRRPSLTWRRDIALRVPVRDCSRWTATKVHESLTDSLRFLTGDTWSIEFYAGVGTPKQSAQNTFDLPSNCHAVIPFSDGLDSRAVAGLMALELKETLVRVRLGSKDYDGHNPQRRPFASVPYRVHAKKGEFVESSARSRGFKFAVLSGLAAHLAKAKTVIVPESGQGALGPALVTVGQAYEDYRNHPLFTARMERFFEALFGQAIQFQFPRLWHTKAETLQEFIARCEDGLSWSNTWSCWQQNRHSSVEGKRRHCGVCAACLLRRLSVHAAKLKEPVDTYVWEDLSTAKFDDGAAAAFPNEKRTKKFREYAIAGALHLDHLASLRSSPANAGRLGLAAFTLSQSLGIPVTEAEQKLDRLLTQHRSEWKSYLASLGPKSFVAEWTVDSQ